MELDASSALSPAMSASRRAARSSGNMQWSLCNERRLAALGHQPQNYLCVARQCDVRDPAELVTIARSASEGAQISGRFCKFPRLRVGLRCAERPFAPASDRTEIRDGKHH